MLSKTAGLIVAPLVLIPAFLLAQLRVDVQLVNVVVTVTDDRGRYVSHLDQDDFILHEDGTPQDIAHFSQDHDVPVSVGVVLDTSGSMERKIRTATEAVEGFIGKIHADDEIFLMTFSGDTTLRQDFTDDRRRLSQALRRIRVSGGTALYDAVAESVAKMHDGRHDKKAILLISDGEDTSSRTTLTEAESLVRESEQIVYALGIRPSVSPTVTTDRIPVPFPWPPILGGPRTNPRSGGARREDTVDMKVLEGFAEASGGRAFLLSESWFTGSSGQVERVLDQIADELRSQYTLGYYPTHGNDGKWHTLKVRVGRGRYHVRAKPGYMAR